jgi:hypothetical protein
VTNLLPETCKNRYRFFSFAYSPFSLAISPFSLGDCTGNICMTYHHGHPTGVRGDPLPVVGIFRLHQLRRLTLAASTKATQSNTRSHDLQFLQSLFCIAMGCCWPESFLRFRSSDLLIRKLNPPICLPGPV